MIPTRVNISTWSERKPRQSLETELYHRFDGNERSKFKWVNERERQNFKLLTSCNERELRKKREKEKERSQKRYLLLLQTTKQLKWTNCTELYLNQWCHTKTIFALNMLRCPMRTYIIIIIHQWMMIEFEVRQIFAHANTKTKNGGEEEERCWWWCTKIGSNWRL